MSKKGFVREIFKEEIFNDGNGWQRLTLIEDNRSGAKI